MLVSQSDLEAKLGRNLTTREVQAFEIVNKANQYYIEDFLLGSPVEEVSATSRYYDGGLQHLPIDPCTEVTRIDWVDDDQNVVEQLDSTDYTLEPVNKTLKTMLRWRSGALPTGINNIKITGKFSTYGDTRVTSIIRDAILESLVAEVNNTGNIKRESIEGYSVEFATQETKNALNKLKTLFPVV